jgi:hypothetical protein
MSTPIIKLASTAYSTAEAPSSLKKMHENRFLIFIFPPKRIQEMWGTHCNFVAFKKTKLAMHPPLKGFSAFAKDHGFIRG